MPPCSCATPGRKPGRIDEGDQRNVEAVAHAHEAGHLVAGIDVDHAGHDGRFLRHNAHAVPADARQTHDGIARPVGLNFEEGALVHDGLDDLMHDIGFAGVERDNGVEPLIHAHGIIIVILEGGIFDIVGGQVGKELPYQRKRLLLRRRCQMRHAADRHVHIRAAQRLGIDHFAGHSLDDLRAGQEHEGLLLHHDDQVLQGGGIGRAARAGAKHHADLRDHAGILRIAPEDLGISAQRLHAFLNARPAGIEQPDAGHAVAQGQVHHAADLVRLHFAESAAVDGEVLGIDVNRPPIDLAVAGHDAIAQVLGGRQPQFIVRAGDEWFDLVEGAEVQQFLDPLGGGHLAFGVLLFDPVLAAALAGFGAHLAQFQYSWVFLHPVPQFL